MTAIILFFAKELLLMQTGRMLTLVVPWSRFWWHRHSCPACAGCWWWSQTPWCPWCCHRWSQTSQKSSVHPAEHNHGAVTVLGIFSANISTLILALCRANSWCYHRWNQIRWNQILWNQILQIPYVWLIAYHDTNQILQIPYLHPAQHSHGAVIETRPLRSHPYILLGNQVRCNSWHWHCWCLIHSHNEMCRLVSERQGIVSGKGQYWVHSYITGFAGRSWSQAGV